MLHFKFDIFHLNVRDTDRLSDQFFSIPPAPYCALSAKGSYSLNSISCKALSFLFHLNSYLVFLYSKAELKQNVIYKTSHSEPIVCKVLKKET